MLLLQIFSPDKIPKFEPDNTKTTPSTSQKKVYVSDRIREEARKQQSKKVLQAPVFSKKWSAQYPDFASYLDQLVERLNTPKGLESFCDGLQSRINQWYSDYHLSPYVLNSDERGILMKRMERVEFVILCPSSRPESEAIRKLDGHGTNVSIEVRYDDAKLKKLEDEGHEAIAGSSLPFALGHGVPFLKWNSPPAHAAHELMHVVSNRINLTLGHFVSYGMQFLYRAHPDSFRTADRIEEGMSSLFAEDQGYPVHRSVIDYAIRDASSSQSRKELMDGILRTYLNLNDSGEIHKTEKVIQDAEKAFLESK